MKNLLKNKKFIFFVILILILVVIAGIFLFWPKKVSEEGPGDFSITGNLIENKDYGLSFLYPDGWNIRNHGVYGIDLFSPEIEFDENGGFLQSARETGGCITSVIIEEAEENSEYLSILIAEVKNGISFFNEDEGKQRVVIIDDKESLETTYFKENKPIYIEIEIPIDNIVYKFSNGMIFSDRCIEEFNKILDTVIISR